MSSEQLVVARPIQCGTPKKPETIEPGTAVDAAITKKLGGAAQRDGLLSAGALVAASDYKVSFAATPVDRDPPTDEEVAEAIKRLPAPDSENGEDFWTMSGKPDATELSDALDNFVSKEQRNRVWEKIKPKG